jgi:4-carboxymuconolactone decarboxylase
MRLDRLATLVADLNPTDLSKEEGVAFDVAYKLVRGGTLPEALYRLAVDTFGQHGTNEMIYLVGLYSLVSMTLNGFNVPVPERE